MIVSKWNSLRLLMLLSCASASLATAAELLPAKTALDDYVNKPDGTYSWSLVKTIEGEGYTGYIIDLKSQTWRTTADVNKPEWRHWLSIVKPKGEIPKTALLFISGGDNKGEAPQGIGGDTIRLATETNSVAVELKQIPNQPLIYQNDGRGRNEDDSIGYTWDKVITTGDPTWSLRMPMVKSAVRAMDATQAFLASPEGGNAKIEHFVVSGASKRGWTTWLTGAVDPRVVAIIPLVIDVLNVRESMRHHFAAYGFWAPAVGDYVRHKITLRNDDTGYIALLAFEDPYSYRHRLTMPKYMINAGGDQFFVPDSSQFYFNDLQGEKYIRYIPNTDHSMRGSDARESLMAFYSAILTNHPRPKFSWTKEADGSLKVKTIDAPREVNLWQAVSPEARDFRLMKIGKVYTSAPLKDQGNGVYVGQVAKPEKGFAAFFVELVYDSGGKYPFKFTTEVSVVPDVLPFKDKPIKPTE